MSPPRPCDFTCRLGQKEPRRGRDEKLPPFLPSLLLPFLSSPVSARELFSVGWPVGGVWGRCQGRCCCKGNAACAVPPSGRESLLWCTRRARWALCRAALPGRAPGGGRGRQGGQGRGLPGRLHCLVPIKGRSCSSGGCSSGTAIKSSGGRGARGMFRAVPRRVARRGGARGGCSASTAAPGSGRGVKGRPGSESQGPSHHRCPPVPSGLAGVRGRDPISEDADAAGGRGWLAPIISRHISPPPAGHLSAVIWDKGGGSGWWSAASWAMGREPAGQKRQQLRRRLGALLIQAVEGAVILC